MARIVIIKSPEPRKRYRFLSEPLEAGNHHVVILDTGNFIQLYRNIFNYVKKKKRPDVVITVGTGIKILFIYFILRTLRVRVIVRLGGNPILDAQEIAKSALSNKNYNEWLIGTTRLIAAKLICRHTDEVIVVNKHIISSMEPYLNKDAKVSIVPQFYTGKPHNRSYAITGAPILLTASNLKFRKKAEGVISLIKNLADFVRTNDTELDLYVAGDGIHLKDISNYIQSSELPSRLRVKLLGYVHNMDHYYNIADIFLYCSEHDASPNVIIESKHWAMPLLVNDYKPFYSIVNNESSGLFYHDEATFQKQFSRLLEDEELRKNLGEQAAQEQISLFSLNTVRNKLETTLFK